MSDTKMWFSWRELDEAKDVLQSQQFERRSELEALGLQLAQLREDEVIDKERHYPIRFLTDGISAYYEAFDNGAIFYAGLSLELAIDIRISQKLQDHGKSLSFKRSIDQAVCLDVLRPQCAPMAHDLRKMRNAYIHYRNVLRYELEVNARTKEKMQGIYPLLQQEMRETISDDSELSQGLKELESVMRSVDNDDGYHKRGIAQLKFAAPNSEIQTFLEERGDAYLEWVQNALTQRDKTRRLSYRTERKDALDSLGWSGILLTELEFLPQ